MFSEKKGSLAYVSKLQWFCKKCNVFLHSKCFKEFHEITNPVSQWTGQGIRPFGGCFLSCKKCTCRIRTAPKLCTLPL